MPIRLNGLHHVTSLASDARATDAFFTHALGLRRVKKTVNFDAPDVYHLYYGDEAGRPGSVMTYFPFPDAAPGRAGTGEVATIRYAIPEGSALWWRDHLAAMQVETDDVHDPFDGAGVTFAAPDGDRFALVEDASDARATWTGGGVPAEYAIRGFHSAALRVRDASATRDLLETMGYVEQATEGSATRFALQGDAATILDLEARPDLPQARQGAGSVHHIAFSVTDRAAQRDARATLTEAGFHVTDVIDRDYFWAIYFREPGGILFEIATDEPGFDRDEDLAHLGRDLKLPDQHAHLHERLERTLPPLD